MDKAFIKDDPLSVINSWIIYAKMTHNEEMEKVLISIFNCLWTDPDWPSEELRLTLDPSESNDYFILQFYSHDTLKCAQFKVSELGAAKLANQLLTGLKKPTVDVSDKKPYVEAKIIEPKQPQFIDSDYLRANCLICHWPENLRFAKKGNWVSFICENCFQNKSLEKEAIYWWDDAECKEYPKNVKKRRKRK